MKVRIEIRVDDSKVIIPILKSDVEEGGYFKYEDDISVKSVPQTTRHAFPGFDVIVFIFEFTVAASASLIANWLYEKLRKKDATIIIGSKKVRIENSDKLKDAIIEATTQEKPDK